MRVLIGGEFSGTIRNEFLKRGHDAWSCDLKPSIDDGPHYTCNWWHRDVAGQNWDLAIFHPTCTYLANSGAKHLYTETGEINAVRWLRLSNAAIDFRNVLEYYPVEKMCIENPIMLGYAKEIIGRSQDQVIQPWMFGDRATKATCLWLKNLPPLEPTDIVGPPKTPEEKKEFAQVHRMGPTKDPEERRMRRSITYPGIARAMAEQWG